MNNMLKSALSASLEGLSDPVQEGGVGGLTIGNIIDPIEPSAPTDIQTLINEATVTLENHYAGASEIYTQTDELNGYEEQNAEEHAEMRGELADLRNHMQAVTGSMEMLSHLRSLKHVDQFNLDVAKVTFESLAKRTELIVPSLEAVDGHITTASMEGLIDFIKAGAAKVKNWFSEMMDNAHVNSLRNIRSHSMFSARIKRLQDMMNKLPSELGRPVDRIQYRDNFTNSLFEKNNMIPFKQESLIAAMKSAGALAEVGINQNSLEHLANIKVITESITGLLVSTGTDGGEKTTRAMFDKLKPLTAIEKIIKYGDEMAGGVTFRETVYRPSLRVASWVMPLVEMLERPRLDWNLRRSGRVSIDILDISTIQAVIDFIIDHLTDYDNRYPNYWSELVEAYNEAVGAYNKTLAVAQQTDHDELTSEVWRAIDIASYGMLQFFNIIVSEAERCVWPSMRLIDGLLYVFEEQVARYVRVNR